MKNAYRKKENWIKVKFDGDRTPVAIRVNKNRISIIEAPLFQKGSVCVYHYRKADEEIPESCVVEGVDLDTQTYTIGITSGVDEGKKTTFAFKQLESWNNIRDMETPAKKPKRWSKHLKIKVLNLATTKVTHTKAMLTESGGGSLI